MRGLLLEIADLARTSGQFGTGSRFYEKDNFPACRMLFPRAQFGHIRRGHAHHGGIRASLIASPRVDSLSAATTSSKCACR